MTPATQLVLVVDDVPGMVQIVCFALHTQGFRTESAADAETAWEIIRTTDVDLVVLDVMLPGLSGIDLCRRVRANTEIPVILLTARAETDDRVAGLEAGADDYVVKPFSPRELALRVGAVLRRGRGGRPVDVVRIGELEIDRGAMRVSLSGVPVSIPAIEYRLLIVLLDSIGQTVRWQDLLGKVWQTDSLSGGREMVKTAMYRLRSRLNDDPAQPRFIVTVRGIGYRMIGRVS